MKKDMLYSGLGFILLGSLFLLAYLLLDGQGFASNYAGFAGGFAGPGIMMVYKYFHWSKPENRSTYKEILKKERIDALDERTVMLRRLAGHRMYLCTVLLLAASIFVLSLLRADRWILLSAAALLMVEIAGGWIVYRHYDKKL